MRQFSIIPRTGSPIQQAGSYRARVIEAQMTTVETVLLIAALLLILLVVGNIVFSRLAERRNPPVGKFIECDGVRLHYIERGDPAAPCVVLFHGNGSMIQDLTIS